MADRGGYGRGLGRTSSAPQGRSRGGRRGARRGAPEPKEWHPISKLGRLVKDGKIASLEEIFVHSLPIKEYQIIDHFYGSKTTPEGRTVSELQEEIMKIMPVQKQTRAGQRTRFKAFVIVGDGRGHIGFGVKCAKEVATAIRGAIISAKLSIMPVRRGYWGNKIGDPHTVPMKLSGKCGSVCVRLIPAPRGTQVVGAPTTKKILQFAGLKDCFTSTTGCSKTRGNFIRAIFLALSKTYGYLTPDLWDEQMLPISPYQKFSEYLSRPALPAKTI